MRSSLHRNNKSIRTTMQRPLPHCPSTISLYNHAAHYINTYSIHTTYQHIYTIARRHPKRAPASGHRDSRALAPALPCTPVFPHRSPAPQSPPTRIRTRAYVHGPRAHVPACARSSPGHSPRVFPALCALPCTPLLPALPADWPPARARRPMSAARLPPRATLCCSV